jgi:hypothetical protein
MKARVEVSQIASRMHRLAPRTLRLLGVTSLNTSYAEETAVLQRAWTPLENETATSAYSQTDTKKNHPLPDLDEAGCKLKLVKGQILRDLSEGKVPQRVNISGGLPINLSKNESIIFVFQGAEFQRLRTRTQYVGASNGMSVRIMKGVYLRSSDYRGERIQNSELQSVGTGLLAITNKNLFFYGPEIVKTPLRKIVGVQPYSDGIGVFTEGQNAKPQIFKLADPFFAANLISLANSLH